MRGSSAWTRWLAQFDWPAWLGVGCGGKNNEREGPILEDETRELEQEIRIGSLVARIWLDLEEPRFRYVTIGDELDLVCDGRIYVHLRQDFLMEELEAVAALATLARTWIKHHDWHDRRRKP